MKPFKTKADRIKWEKENCLTVGRFIEYLSKLPKDSVIYTNEPNTNTWQAVHRVDRILNSVKGEKKRLRESLNGWFRGSTDPKSHIKTELKAIFRYTYDKDGYCITV